MDNPRRNEGWDTIIRPRKGWLDIDIKGLIRYRDLILLMVKRNFTVLYKQTILGPAWVVIQPLLTTVVFTVIFGNIAGLPTDGMPKFLFYMAGNIVWQFFAQCLTVTSTTFVTNRNLFGKVYFPRLVMPISTAISQYITFGIQFAFMLVFLVYYLIAGKGVHPNLYVLFLPVILIQTAVLGTGLGIIISSLTTKYRDLTMAVGFFVSLWQYASPIAYDMFSRRSLYEKHLVYYFYMLNPVTPIINMFRYAFLGTGEIDWLYYGISVLTTVLVAVIGVRMFSKVERTFMDTV